jgi:hypothetical protein
VKEFQFFSSSLQAFPLTKPMLLNTDALKRKSNQIKSKSFLSKVRLEFGQFLQILLIHSRLGRFQGFEHITLK